MSAPEDALLWQLQAAGVPPPFREYRFAQALLGRAWRADFAFYDAALLVEVEGGSWSAGRHTRGAGFQEDCLKYAVATILGWRIIRCTPDQIADGTALALITLALDVRPPPAGLAVLSDAACAQLTRLVRS